MEQGLNQNARLAIVRKLMLQIVQHGNISAFIIKLYRKTEERLHGSLPFPDEILYFCSLYHTFCNLSFNLWYKILIMQPKKHP